MAKKKAPAAAPAAPAASESAAAGGSAWAKKHGLKPIMVYVSEDELWKLKEAAVQEKKKMNHFVRDSALEAATRVLGK